MLPIDTAMAATSNIKLNDDILTKYVRWFVARGLSGKLEKVGSLQDGPKNILTIAQRDDRFYLSLIMEEADRNSAYERSSMLYKIENTCIVDKLDKKTNCTFHSESYVSDCIPSDGGVSEKTFVHEVATSFLAVTDRHLVLSTVAEGKRGSDPSGSSRFGMFIVILPRQMASFEAVLDFFNGNPNFRQAKVLWTSRNKPSDKIESINVFQMVSREVLKKIRATSMRPSSGVQEDGDTTLVDNNKALKLFVKVFVEGRLQDSGFLGKVHFDRFKRLGASNFPGGHYMKVDLNVTTVEEHYNMLNSIVNEFVMSDVNNALKTQRYHTVEYSSNYLPFLPIVQSNSEGQGMPNEYGET
jgi:hypothetical protein